MYNIFECVYMNFIFDEWISDKHVASRMKEKLSMYKVIH